jgi:peptidoglycan/xylan/chitin deacetylase (PgdA/CDA1 family)
LIKNNFISIRFNQIDECTPENNYFILTFDDCFKDVLINAVPIMLKYNVTGTFFPVVNYIDRLLYGSPLDLKWSMVKNLSYNIEYNFMDLCDLKYLISLNMEIGNHTVNHKNLNEFSNNVVLDEINNATSYWKKELNYTVTTFCYPRGKYNSDTIRLLEESGICRACTTISGYVDNKDRFEIHRFYPPTNYFELKSLLKGDFYNLNILQRILVKLCKF